MPVLLEKREAGGLRKWLLAGTVAVDWAEMRVLQLVSRGLSPKVSALMWTDFDEPLRRHLPVAAIMDRLYTNTAHILQAAERHLWYHTLKSKEELCPLTTRKEVK